MSFRTDRHRNPAAFTVDLAKQAGLKLGVDYLVGDPFPGGRFFTAKLLGDPVEITIRLIDRVGFFTKTGAQRWSYAAWPQFAWLALPVEVKRQVIGWMYQHEGGTELRALFTAATAHPKVP
jgi:hypothetical protein